MTTPQVVTLTAGVETATLSTRDVARYVAALTRLGMGAGSVRYDDARTVLHLRDTLRDLCGADHLAAVMGDAATTSIKG